jgi:hypothetical protein
MVGQGIKDDNIYAKIISNIENILALDKPRADAPKLWCVNIIIRPFSRRMFVPCL